MKTLRAHGFNQRPRFEQVVGYLEQNEPLPLDQPDCKAVTSHTSTWTILCSPARTPFVTFWDNDAGSKIHLLANPGQDVAPIGAARQEDSLLESQMQLGSLQYPHNPMKGASEHFHFLSVLAGAYDDTVRNIDIGRVGYLRHSFIASFPTERVPKMLTPLGRPCPVHLQGPGRHDDGPVHSFGGLPAGDALRNGCVRPGLKTAWRPTRRPGRNQACVRRANFFFVRIKKPDLPLRTMKLALGPVQSNAKGGRYVSLEDSEEIFYRRNCAVEILWKPEFPRRWRKAFGHLLYSGPRSPRLGAVRGRHRRG